MNLLRKPLLYLTAGAWLLTACNNDEQSVAPTTDNEALTTVTLQLTNKADATDVVTATVDNLNQTAPDFSKATLNLKSNATYSGQISLLDKSRTPPLDATAEIRKLVNEHLFVYTPAPAGLLTVTLTDKDTNPAPGPYPVGITFELTPMAKAGTGTLNVVLRHQPNSKNGTAAPGTSDLDTTFPVVVR